MVLVKGATKARPSSMWIDTAIGMEDEYGNPFELIELIAVNTRTHKYADYQKTRGFEDAIITVRGGNIRITYRRRGSVVWIRPLGVGPFYGKLAKTPHNMKMLASHYKDGLWRIKEKHIENEVQAMSDKLWESMDKHTRLTNEARISDSRVLEHEKSMKNDVDEQLALKRQEMEEQKSELAKKHIEMKKREALLEEREGEVNRRKADIAYRTGNAQSYSMEYLSTLKLSELRKLARTEFKISYDPKHKMADLRKLIFDVQNGEVTQPALPDDIELPEYKEGEEVMEGVTD